MYTNRIIYSLITSLIMIFIHKYIKIIPDMLQKLTILFSSILSYFSWYKNTYDNYLQLLLIVLLPIFLVTLIEIVYKIIFKEDFNYKISTTWLLWLFLAIPHVMF